MKFSKLFVSLVCVLVVTSCEKKTDKVTSSPSVSSPAKLGDFSKPGKHVIEDLLDNALSGCELSFPKINLSGGSSKNEFAKQGKIVVRNASPKEIGEKIHGELSGLRKKYKWSASGVGKSNDRLIMLQFKESGAQYYMDFVLTQLGKDVEFLVLYKGYRN